MKIIDRKIRERFFLTFSELAKLSFESSLIDASDDLRFIVSDLLDIDATPIARVDAVATDGAVTFELDCNTTEFQERVQDADLEDKAFKQAYWHVWRGAEILASGDCLLYKSTSTQGQSPAPTPIDTFATTEYVDEQIEALKTDLEPQLEAIKEDTEAIRAAMVNTESEVIAWLEGLA